MNGVNKMDTVHLHQNNWKFPAGAPEQMLVINFKVLHGLRPPFWRSTSSLLHTTGPPGQKGRVCYRDHQLHLVGPLKRAFLVVAPYLWNIENTTGTPGPYLTALPKGPKNVVVLSMGLGTTNRGGADWVVDLIVLLLPWWCWYFMDF